MRMKTKYKGRPIEDGAPADLKITLCVNHTRFASWSGASARAGRRLPAFIKTLVDEKSGYVPGSGQGRETFVPEPLPLLDEIERKEKEGLKVKAGSIFSKRNGHKTPCKEKKGQ